MKEAIKKITEDLMLWLYQHFVGIIILQSVIVFLSWLGGYWIMGLATGKYDLSSCGTAMGSIAAAAATGWGKWVVDSWKNSKQGEMPILKGDKNESNN